jgi:hypothetical protein
MSWLKVEDIAVGDRICYKGRHGYGTHFGEWFEVREILPMSLDGYPKFRGVNADGRGTYWFFEDDCWTRHQGESAKALRDEALARVAEQDAVRDEHAVREGYLEIANRIIHGARNQEYGHPYNDFEDIAELWSTFLGRVIERKEVAAMMILLKVARLKHNHDHEDSWVDVAGYVGCADRIQRVIDGIETP